VGPEARADVLPASIRGRKKLGFGAPVAVWFRGAAAGTFRARLLSPEARVRAYVDSSRVREWFSTHASGQADYGMPLWRLWALEEWLRWASGEAPRVERRQTGEALTVQGRLHGDLRVE
jgi:asparagine synthase (glutamine-hydrolysing)